MKLEIYPPPGKPSSPPTWEDIERLALHYAVVHRAVSLVRRGELTREEALIHVAFALAGAFQQLFQGEVERRMMEVAPMIIVKPSSSPAEVSPWEEESQAIIANLRADLVEAQERIKTLVIYGDSASEMLGREAGKVVTLRAELADAQRERYVMEKARDDARAQSDRLQAGLAEAHAIQDQAREQNNRLRERIAVENKELVAMTEQFNLVKENGLYNWKQKYEQAEAGLRYIYFRGYTGAASIANDVLEGKDLPDDDYRIVAQRNP